MDKPEPTTTLEREFARAINMVSAENASNTPDWILGQFLGGVLKAWDAATQQRETWYGRDARPSSPAPAQGQQERRVAQRRVDSKTAMSLHLMRRMGLADRRKPAPQFPSVDSLRCSVCGSIAGPAQACIDDFCPYRVEPAPAEAGGMQDPLDIYRVAKMRFGPDEKPIANAAQEASPSVAPADSESGSAVGLPAAAPIDVLRRVMGKLREDSGDDPMEPFAYDASWEALAKEADAVLAAVAAPESALTALLARLESPEWRPVSREEVAQAIRALLREAGK